MKRLGVIALAKGKRTRWSQSARGVSAMLFIASMMYVADATRALDLKQLRLSVAHVASSSISFVQDPINAVVGVYDGLRELAQLRADNQRMRLEIAELSKWQSRAVLLGRGKCPSF
jgi:Cell shape-determining protein